MDTTNVLNSYFMTVDMHRFGFLWLVHSRNKFIRVGPNMYCQCKSKHSAMGEAREQVILKHE